MATTEKAKEAVDFSKALLNDDEVYMSLLLYGKAGSGKSILASTFPDAMILDADNGHKNYKKQFPEHVYIPSNYCLDALSYAIDELATKGRLEWKGKIIKTLIIDSLTNIENMAISQAKGVGAADWHKNIYQGKGKMRKLTYDDWGSVSGSTIAMLTNLRNLPINTVIITQMSKTFMGDRIIYTPNLVGKGADESEHFADILGFMTVGDGGRWLHVYSNEDDNFVAKIRAMKNKVEPIKNPNYEKLLEIMQNKKSELDFSK